VAVPVTAGSRRGDGDGEGIRGRAGRGVAGGGGGRRGKWTARWAGGGGSGPVGYWAARPKTNRFLGLTLGNGPKAPKTPWDAGEVEAKVASDGVTGTTRSLRKKMHGRAAGGRPSRCPKTKRRWADGGGRGRWESA